MKSNTGNPKTSSAEAQLHNYQKRIANILESFTDAFFEVDSKWKVTYWNKEAELLLLKPRDQIIGKNLWEEYEDAIPLKFYSEYHRAVAENIAVRFEEYFFPKKIWVEVAAFPSGEGLSVYFKDITDRKKTEVLLKNEKQKYTDLFNLSPIPQWVYDVKTLQFLSVNEAVIKHYGFSRDEFLKMKISDLIPQEDLKKFKDILNTKNIRVHVNSSILRHRKKNGDLIIMNVEGNAVVFDGIGARLVMAIDQTERINAEQALAKSEQRFKALVQNGSDLIAILDKSGSFQYVSPTAIPILGIASEELIGKFVLNSIHPEDKIKTYRQFHTLKEKKHFKLLPFRFRNAKGQYQWMETIVTNMTDDPAIAGIVVNSRDITKRIENEIKTEESIKRFNIVSKATSDAIWDWNINTGQIVWNQGIKGIFGHKCSSYNFDWWKAQVHPEDLEKVFDQMSPLLQQKKTRMQIEYRFRCADGKYKTVLDRSFILFDAAGSPQRMIGSMQDITERINQIKAIEAHNERLKDISWIQAHELRAPLASIMGLTQLLNEYVTDPASIKELSNYLIDSAKQLDKVINDILKKATSPKLP